MWSPPKGKHDEMKPKNEILLEESAQSMYDYTQNAFPAKEKTAVLTAVQKDYGDEHVEKPQQITNYYVGKMKKWQESSI